MRKTGEERVLVMSCKLLEVLDVVIDIVKPIPSHYIFSSQKGKGRTAMTVQCFNRNL